MSEAAARAALQVPDSLRRPGRPDPLMRFARFLIGGYESAATSKPPRPARRVDRDLRLVVGQRRDEAEGAIGLSLVARNRAALPPWSPGAHVDIVLPSGTMRQYSLCGDPADRREYRVAVRLVPGGQGSGEIHRDVREGTELVIRGPRNGFPFAYPHLARADISSILFIAGGIGITAILPMVRAAAANRIDWRLVYVGRGKASLPFLAELEALGPERVETRVGRSGADELLRHAGASTSVYFCGPPGMLAEVRAAVDRRSSAGFHFERFSAPPVVGGSPFTVRLASTGEDIAVEATASALAAVRQRLPDVAYSCQQGFCGTCRVRVVDGTVERRGRSQFLDEPGTMLLCSDRAEGDRLTVDL
ncbi:MAG: PDR/VanB family oxidoreductase [Segniliparus sp.]|uniref:PDR/VanB family oxidoreductase n=1 Tax=Segniliparus sp. TaxID=2804064 RepID=UPI003F406406